MFYVVLKQEFPESRLSPGLLLKHYPGMFVKAATAVHS